MRQSTRNQSPTWFVASVAGILWVVWALPAGAVATLQSDAVEAANATLFQRTLSAIQCGQTRRRAGSRARIGIALDATRLTKSQNLRRSSTGNHSGPTQTRIQILLKWIEEVYAKVLFSKTCVLIKSIGCRHSSEMFRSYRRVHGQGK